MLVRPMQHPTFNLGAVLVILIRLHMCRLDSDLLLDFKPLVSLTSELLKLSNVRRLQSSPFATTSTCTSHVEGMRAAYLSRQLKSPQRQLNFQLMRRRRQVMMQRWIRF